MAFRCSGTSYLRGIAAPRRAVARRSVCNRPPYGVNLSPLHLARKCTSNAWHPSSDHSTRLLTRCGHFRDTRISGRNTQESSLVPPFVGSGLLMIIILLSVRSRCLGCSRVPVVLTKRHYNESITRVQASSANWCTCPLDRDPSRRRKRSVKHSRRHSVSLTFSSNADCLARSSPLPELQRAAHQSGSSVPPSSTRANQREARSVSPC